MKPVPDAASLLEASKHTCHSGSPSPCRQVPALTTRTSHQSCAPENSCFPPGPASVSSCCTSGEPLRGCYFYPLGRVGEVPELGILLYGEGWIPIKLALIKGFPGGPSGKEPTYQCSRCERHGFSSWVGKIPWKRAWQLTPVFLPGESHGQRNCAGYSP